ncbi:hypothetical protein SNE25_18335 [Mucilaginibacter sabulilitoris]|uniref:Uncharacterized protein n=1 Tax=Mucilaginibacter sabulilitoris TaxID=1173583 RepID=A0ABZ0TG95_9SPHI|nr:hypothetical protein [Mucilaginibacter sabulilitoris]WPU91278.1 hypothetical protein SNE25_18335 [Mucilaginibacter sabulilitoris]
MKTVTKNKNEDIHEVYIKEREILWELDVEIIISDDFDEFNSDLD